MYACMRSLIVSGISKIMHCGILINKPYYQGFLKILVIIRDVIDSRPKKPVARDELREKARLRL